ncbi:MAG TPA: SDR family NAD(P)-dependent oxidoreductase [Anaeromyxobacteraceae bacterium]|nr:SDR family NAD(P)-dependent oxidoreductase [Anaeromyxobacteraceae bacterium]
MADPGRFRARYGPRALIVGGTDGIGAAFATALAGLGLDLELVARRADLLEEVAGSLRRRYGVAVGTLQADAATASGTSEILARARAGDVGLLVCNAALSPIGTFLDLPFEVHERLLDLNCRSAAVLAHGVGRELVARGRGGIVLLTSMASFQGSALVAHYAASKAYLRVLAEGLWEELRRDGVDVLACCAGRVRTPTYERSHAGDPGWLAPPVLEPEVVVRSTLAALGRRPVVIPGRLNRLAALLTERLLPRRAAVACVSAATRAMYPASDRRGSRRPAGPGDTPG